MRDCDTLLVVGSNFPYSQFLPDYGQARAVQIDIDEQPDREPVSDGGQHGAVASAPLDRDSTAGSQGGPRVAEAVEKNVGRWWETVERQCMLSAKPVNPMRIAWELSDACRPTPL